MAFNNSLTLNWNHHYTMILLPNTVINIICLIFGLVGNTTVLFVYSQRLKCENEDRCFIPKLAALDLIAIVSSTIIHVSDYFYFVNYPSDVMCRTLNFFSCFTSTGSAHMLLVIGIQRYMKVCTEHGTKITKWRKKAAFIIILMISLGYSIPVLVASGVRDVDWVFNENNITGHSCSVIAHSNAFLNNHAYYIALLAILIINILVTVSVYVPIGRVIYKRSKFSREWKHTYLPNGGNETHPNEAIVGTRSNSQGNTTMSEIRFQYKQNRIKKIRRCKVNFNLMFLTLVFFYLLSYLPTIVMFVITTQDKHFWFKLPGVELNILIFMNRLFIVEHTVNPYIYSIFDYKFRHYIKRLLGWKGK